MLLNKKFELFIIVLLAGIMGIVITKASITILFLLLGGFAGIALFMNPAMCFWLIFISVFFVGGVVTFFPELTTLRWAIVLLSLMLGMSAILQQGMHSAKTSKIPKNKILLFIIGFILTGLLSSFANGIPVRNIVIAAKNYYQFVPIFFALIILPYFNSKDKLKLISYALITIAFIQVPYALFQRLVICPRLEAAGNTSIAVVDAVNGSFGNTLAGGASDTLSFFLIFAIGLLIAFGKHKQLKWKKVIPCSFVLFLPIILNETKISFVYIIIVFIVVFRDEIIKKPSKAVVLLLSLFIVLGTFIYTYRILYASNWNNADDYLSTTIAYNFGDRGYGIYKLNRLTCITFWIENNDINDPFSILFGHGLDTTNEAETGIGRKGWLSDKYYHYGIGLTLVSKLLWETGIFGLSFFFMILASSYRKVSRCLKNSDSKDFGISILYGLKAGIALCVLVSFVNSAYRDVEVFNFLFYLIVGLATLFACKDNLETA